MHKMAIQRTLLLQKLKTFEADVNTDDGANSPVHFEIDSNLNVKYITQFSFFSSVLSIKQASVKFKIEVSMKVIIAML